LVLQGDYRQGKNKKGSYDRNGIDAADWHAADANPRRGHEEWRICLRQERRIWNHRTRKIRRHSDRPWKSSHDLRQLQNVRLVIKNGAIIRREERERL
jgi:hypothetical protein